MADHGDRTEPTAVESLARILERATGTAVARDDVLDRSGSPSPGARIGTLLDTAGSVVGVVPRVEPSLAQRMRRGATSGSVDGDGAQSSLNVRIVVTGAARETVTGPTGAVVRRALTDDITLYVHDGDSPVGLLLVDDRAVVGAFDDAGLAAVLVSDEPAVRSWVAETCERYLSTAEPLET